MTMKISSSVLTLMGILIPIQGRAILRSEFHAARGGGGDIIFVGTSRAKLLASLNGAAEEKIESRVVCVSINCHGCGGGCGGGGGGITL